MMTEQEILKIFADTGALLEGHFELRSKLHSRQRLFNYGTSFTGYENSF